MTKIQALEIDAMSVAAQNDFDEAIKIMQKALALEAAMLTPSGPPPVIKPLHELFGEILLRAGRPKEAAEQFATSLRRHPNRARSLLGAARAAAQNGEIIHAANRYAQFAFQWKQSDVQLPELREAQEYTKQNGER
jgi:tetratricopeptide (TPR) repeat protein